MSKFLSGRQRNLNLGISSVTENTTVLQTIGKVGIGTSTAENYSLYVDGSTRITRDLNIGRDLIVSGIATFREDIYLGNNDRINLGGTNDLQIYNDGSNSYIVDAGIGNLFIRGTAAINFQDATGTEDYAKFNVDGATELYFDNDKKFETTEDGIDITGHVETDTLRVSGITTVDGGPLFVGGATSTGTINQNLQVLGGAYISTYVSIGYTNPFANLTVFDQSGPWIALVDPGQSSSAFEDNAGNLYIRSESGSGTAGEIVFQTGTANYQLRPSQSGSNRMRIDNDGDVLINSDNSTGTIGQKLQVFGSSYVEDQLGIGNTNPTYKLEVIGDTVITGFTSIGKQTDITGNLFVAGISTLNGLLTLGDDVTIAGDLDVDGHTELDNVNISGIVTAFELDVDGHTELDNVNVSGTLTAYNLDVTNDFDIYAPDSVFYGNVTIQGDVSIGGTSILLDAETIRIEDKEIILGFTTTVTPNDNTANSAGIAVASTEGHSLVPLQVVGINSLPNTYKQWLWYKHNTMGAGTTDAWLSNQAVGIGSTLVPNNIRLAVGDVKIGDFSIDVRNIAGTAATITRGNFEILDAKTSYIDVGFATHLSGTSLNYIGISTINNVRGETLTLSGVSTFSGNVDIDADVDIDGHTELDNVNISGIVTAYELDVDGHTELDNVNISGVTTFVGSIDANSDLDVDGHTELDNVNISGIVTAFELDVDGHTELDNVNISGIVTAFELDVDGHTELDNVNISGVTTFVGSIDANSDLDVDGHTELDNVNISGIVTAFELDVDGHTELDNVNISGIVTAFELDVDGHTELDNVNISGVTTFVGSIDANSDLDVDGHTELDNVNISGIVTAFDLDVEGHTELDNINVSGVSTFVGIGTFLNDLYVGGDLYVADDLILDEFTARNATLTGNLQVVGVSTFNGNVDINADIDVDGHTELDNVNISGVTTFGSYLDINSFVDISGNINVGGLSTFTGIGTFQNDLYVGGDLYVADDLVFDELTARNATLTGNINGDTLIISGLTTFTTGPVLVGTGTSTGTGAQAFQVDSGAYFAGPIGVASTAPNYNLDVNGDINFNGDLYKDGLIFVSGVGIGSTEVNPQSAIITPEARVGSGFTDINFVGTGLSVTGYGSTVVIDLDSVGGARVSVSTEPPVVARAGDLWWESDSGDLKVFYVDGDSTQWVDTNGGENLAVIGEFPPVSPLAGDLWWDSVYGQLKIYYDDGDSQQWVDTSNAGISNYWVSADPPYVGIHTSYNVGIGTTIPNEALDVIGYISIDDRVSYGATTFETSSTSQVGIHSAVPITSYRSVDYTIQATQGSSYHTTKITALHDGSTAYHTEYGTIYNSASVATYDVDVSGGNLRLLATPASSGITTYNIIFDAIKV